MSNKTKKTIDPKPIKDLTKILDELNLSEISYSDGDFSVTVAKGTRVHAADNLISSNQSKEQNLNDGDGFKIN